MSEESFEASYDGMVFAGSLKDVRQELDRWIMLGFDHCRQRIREQMRFSRFQEDDLRYVLWITQDRWDMEMHMKAVEK